MKNKPYLRARPVRQSGVMLLEALIAILVFSLGILTVIGIQAASIKLAADAKLRTQAALLANQLVGEMWTSGDKIDELATKFSSPSGAQYLVWLNCHVAPNDSCTGTPPNSSGLPGVSGDDGTLPTVSVETTPGSEAGRVEIVLSWRTPSMDKEVDEPHRYTVISQISRNQ
jgi:type IV pilus assembly protein PilV